MSHNGSSTALLVIDTQRGLFERAQRPIYQSEELLDNICALTERSHAVGAAVFYIQHCNASSLAPETPGWQLHPRLQPRADDVVLRKRHGNAFEETDLHRELTARGVRTVVVVGLVSHFCVRDACRGAQALGYRVILASDGHSNLNKKAANIIKAINREMGEAGVEVCPSAAIEF
jgi:nicotinamidase-related amidase